MKETPDKHLHPDVVPGTYTDPILEECYRIKRKISAEMRAEQARFSTQEEYFEHLKAQEAELKKQGWKFIPAPPHPADTAEKKD